LYLADDRRDVPGKAIGIGFQIGDGAITNISKPWIAEYNTASLGGLQCVLGALCNHLAFVLCNGGQDVNGELVGVRIVHRDELDTGVHQRGDESQMRDSRSSLAITSLAFCRLQIVKAFSSSGRSLRLPLSI
jgi:hypothetical protein